MASPGGRSGSSCRGKLRCSRSVAGEILVDDIASDLPSLPRLDAAGNLSFRFGGRVTIRGDADGQYRGDLPITVEYQ